MDAQVSTAWPTGHSLLRRRTWLQVLMGGLLGASATEGAVLQSTRLEPVADGVFVLKGVNQEPGPLNQGQVINTAVVVCGRSLLVVDPGPHVRAGRHLAELIQDSLHLPVRWVVNTHAHPENVLANAAFAGLPVYAGPWTTRLMRARCQACRRRLTRLLGDMAMEGTRIVLPNRAVPVGDWVLGGRLLHNTLFEHAHSREDLVLWDRATGALLAGGLAYAGRIPEMAEASVTGWLRALQVLHGWPVGPVVSAGVGALTDTVEATQAYLQTLHQQVWAAIEAGQVMSEASQRIRMPAWSAWAGHSERQALNVQRAWRELEALWWERGG